MPRSCAPQSTWAGTSGSRSWPREWRTRQCGLAWRSTAARWPRATSSASRWRVPSSPGGLRPGATAALPGPRPRPPPDMVAIALLGTIVGSFLNVVIHRLPRGESLVRPRSRCPECGSPVRPLDNVPLVSWLALRGRCRDCRASIPARYPLVELVTGATFAAVVLTRGLGPHLAFELPFVAVVIAVAAVDVDHGIVPNKVLAPAAGWGVTALAAIDPHALP